MVYAGASSSMSCPLAKGEETLAAAEAVQLACKDKIAGKEQKKVSTARYDEKVKIKSTKIHTGARQQKIVGKDVQKTWTSRAHMKQPSTRNLQARLY